MADKEDFALRLAERLRAARKAQKLSLEALAERSGVSRSMLSAIERCESSPTVASLWNLTNALGVDFSGLLDDGAKRSAPILEIVRADQAPVIQTRGAGCRIKILSPPADVGEAEVYDLSLAAGGVLESAPHRAGAVEHLTVLDGDLEIASGDAKERVTEGETIRYRADLPHAIRALDGAARAVLIVKGA
ncbi:MAG: XRE family transcriptional regulator [Neomegalonema sp.]|nr:XRE family transcriptional regulator [Neomegalonema sp.]